MRPEGCRFAVVALLLPLSGCAGLTNVLIPPYIPEPIRIYDKAQYEYDVAECRVAGANYKPHFSFGKVATGAAQGATANTSLIPVTPLVVVYGAAGGAAGAASDGLDIMSGEHANVFRNCVRDEVRMDHSAIVADPRP